MVGVIALFSPLISKKATIGAKSINKMTQQRLSADPSALVLGLLSVALAFLAYFQWGFTSIITITLGIFGLIKSKKSIRLYKSNNATYDLKSYNIVKTGKVLCIIGIIVNFVIICFWILIFIIGYDTSQIEFN